MSFWADYVLLKEKNGISRETTLNVIQQKFGEEKRIEIENELNQVVE